MAKLAVSPPHAVSPGETVAVVGEDSREGDEFGLRAEGGLLYAGPTKAQATIGVRRLPDGHEKRAPLHQDGQKIYVHNPSSSESRDLHIWEQNPVGFSLFSVDVEADFNRATDIAAQSVGDISSDQNRRSAESLEEVNADQTETIATGGDQTTTTRADSGGVWQSSGFYFEWSPDSDWDGTSGENVEVTVQSEKEGVEHGHVRTSGGLDSNDTLYFRSGAWELDSGGSSLTGTRNDIIGHQIDDTNGVNVVFNNLSSNFDVANVRKIRWEFEAVKA